MTARGGSWLRRAAVALVVAIAAAAGGLVALGAVGPGAAVAGFRRQACALPRPWLERVRAGFFAPRAGEISILPATPAYMASGAGGWSHSGPWDYLQRVPLVFYGPGIVSARGEVERPATLADVAPTLAALVGGRFEAADGAPLPEVARPARPRPRLVVVVVWDGGGWNALRAYPRSWPTLARLAAGGVSYTNATVGSSPSVTPATHTTLGTGALPDRHGVTAIKVRDRSGEVVDSFLRGESSRFIRVRAFAEAWDEANSNRALVGMIGYEPWHLGMIGRGAERRGGDRDHAAWLDVRTNEWITNGRHYSLPPAVPVTRGLAQRLRRLDAADGDVDGAWRTRAILGERDRVEETPAFVAHHARVLRQMIRAEGYGADAVADLLFTNFKQIDRVAHYFSMHSPEVRDSLAASDRALGHLVASLDARVGRGRWVVVVTADHGLQPDESVTGGYGINPTELERDLAAEFGPVVHSVLPTEVFVDRDEMADRGVAVPDVARFVADYRLRDNVSTLDALLFGVGRFDPGDRLFDMAIPADLLPRLACGGGAGAASTRIPRR